MKRTLLPLAALAFGCGADFTPREEIDRLRTFGILSEVQADPSLAWPRTAQTTRLSALVTRERPEGQVRATWRFCPVAFGSGGGFECAVSEEDFSELLESVIRDAAANLTELLEMFPDLELPPGFDPEDFMLPDELQVGIEPDFELGTSTVSLGSGVNRVGIDFNLRDVFFPEQGDLIPEFILDLGIRALCEQLQGAEFPEVVERPSCNGVFPFRIDVELQILEAGREVDDPLLAQRFLDVVYDPTVTPNRNPDVEGFCISPLMNDPSREEAMDLRCDDPVFPTWVQTSTLPYGLFFDTSYGLSLEGLEEDDAETFEVLDPEAEPGTTAREQLTVSWFIDAGGIDRTRTAFDADEEASPIERARYNEWELPREIDFDDPPADGRVELIAVVRDGRGGRAFNTVRLPLVRAPQPLPMENGADGN